MLRMNGAGTIQTPPTLVNMGIPQVFLSGTGKFSILPARMSNPSQNSEPRNRASDAQIEVFRKRTLTLSVVEGCVWAVMWGFGEAFVGPFAVFLKASDFSMSLLCTLPLVLGALSQLFGGWLVERLGRRRPVMSISALIQAFVYLPLFWIPFFFPGAGVAIVIILFTLTVMLISLGVPAFNSIMGELVPETIRGQYFGKRSGLNMLVMVISMLLAGGVIAFFEERNNLWLGFGIVFTIAMLARAYGTLLLTRYYEPPFHPSTEESFSFFKFLKTLPRSNFGRFTLAMAVMNGASSISAPFFTQYMLRDLHWSKSQFAIASGMLLLSQFVFIRWWGKICDRHGNRSVIRATSFLLPILPTLWIITQNYHILLCFQAISGLVWSGFNLASANFIYDSIPSNQRHRVFAYYTVVISLFTLIGGSVVGAWLATHLPSTYQIGGMTFVFLSSLPAVFVVSGLLRAVVGIILFPLFKEIRHGEPISAYQILWRVSTGEPIMNHITEIWDTLPSPFRPQDGEKKDK